MVVDGDFGAKTDAAIKDFQSKNGLMVDGVAGSCTLKALDDKQRLRVNIGAGLPLDHWKQQVNSKRMPTNLQTQ